MGGSTDFLGLAKRALRYRSLQTARLIHANMPFQPAPLQPDGMLVRCDDIGLSFDPRTESIFVEGLRFVYPTMKAGAGRFERNEVGRLEFRAGPVRIVPETVQELAILDEVFREGVYDLEGRGEWIVWDVGMNVGIATAFFAGIKGWEVSSYEPFPEPYAAAVANVERSGLADRVRFHPQGVSDRACDVRLSYNGGSRGSNGLYGNNAVDKVGEDVEIPVTFVDAADAVEALCERASGRPILAKIDCEGAEYGIVRRLLDVGRLTSLTAIVMEYHLLSPEHDYDTLVRDLIAAGFVIHGQRHPEGHVGMLWAVSPDYGAHTQLRQN